MRADIVVDASVAAKFYFHEDGSDRARTLLTSGALVAAPDLLFLEMASLAATRVRRGLESAERGRDAVVSVTDLIDHVAASSDLRVQAFALASEDGFSAYDGAYLALAERLTAPIVTADKKLVERARLAGLGRFVRQL